ncbi:MAG: hypothetical protein EKK37_05610 [Sphingobacteriales bacterium]|nr:MAG: hypothetical protein EKK37_05610 [Sphingobacteriales bacterium]
MKKFFLPCVLLISYSLLAQKKEGKLIKGIYLQWGYNTEWYTRSTLHFRMANGDNFRIYNVKAHDKRDYDAIISEPGQISIPQYNYRIGFYLNKSHTKAFEINFDHAKYIVTDGQTAHVKGRIDGVNVDQDMVLDPKSFLHFEHTDGANWLHFNYVEQHTLKKTASGNRPLFTYIWKAGAGFNIPRTDFTWRGNRLNNDFHIAGYNISAEGGSRFYPFKTFFIETTVKSGFVHYINALTNTTTDKGNRASHKIGYFELIATFGFDIN